MRIYSFQILIWYQRRRSTTTASVSHLLSKFRNLTTFLLRRFYLQRGQSRGHRRPYWFLPIRMFTSFRCNFSAKTKKWREKNVPHRWNILFRTSPCKICIIWTFNIGNRYGQKKSTFASSRFGPIFGKELAMIFAKKLYARLNLNI